MFMGGASLAFIFFVIPPPEKYPNVGVITRSQGTKMLLG